MKACYPVVTNLPNTVFVIQNESKCFVLGRSKTIWFTTDKMYKHFCTGTISSFFLGFCFASVPTAHKERVLFYHFLKHVQFVIANERKWWKRDNMWKLIQYCCCVMPINWLVMLHEVSYIIEILYEYRISIPCPWPLWWFFHK